MDQDVWKGQAVYSLPFLKIWYDIYVLGVNNHLVWKCPTRELVDHYNRHITGNHIEVGVGSAYLLTRCSFPATAPRLVLGYASSILMPVDEMRVSLCSPA